jgi:hypothetical protein
MLCTGSGCSLQAQIVCVRVSLGWLDESERMRVLESWVYVSIVYLVVLHQDLWRKIMCSKGPHIETRGN